MRLIKILLCILCLLCPAGQALAESNPDQLIVEYYQKDKRTTWRMYIVAYVSTYFESLPEEERAAYNGVAFPLYCGYVTFYPEGAVRFTKMTDLPIKHIVEFFDRAEKEKKVKTSHASRFLVDKAYGYETSVREIDDTDPILFQEVIEAEMHRYWLGVVRRDWWREMPDLDHRPEYKEMCIFNAKKPGECYNFRGDLLNPDATSVDSLLAP